MKYPTSVILTICCLMLLQCMGIGQALTVPFGDDGFNAGCCSSPQPNLPPFPNLVLHGKYACMLNCNLDNEWVEKVVLGTPIMFQDDYAIIPLTVTPLTAGGPGFTTVLLAKYSRTWLEAVTLSSPGSPQRQVWRFIVNTDISFQSIPGIAASSPCPVPSCGAGPLNRRVHFVGSVDYALKIGPNGPDWKVALNLTHFPGCISHASWSQAPISGQGGHRQRSYHLVAPATFDFATPTPTPAGDLKGEAVRASELVWPPTSGPFYTCYGESQVSQGGSINITMANCLCTAATSGPRWKHLTLGGMATCGTTKELFNSVPLSGTPFPTGFVALSLGRYTSGTTFPNDREMSVYFGVMQYHDPCLAPASPFHVVTGVGHIYPGELFHPQTPGGPFQLPVTTTGFTDLANVLPLVAGPLRPGWGSLFVSTLVWNLNTP